MQTHIHISNATIHLTNPAALSAFAALESTVSATVQTPANLTPPASGAHWPGQGGIFICTLPAIGNLPARHLIAADADITEKLTYGELADITAASSHTDGVANTQALLASGHAHPAAAKAARYTADGHADFFLPSRLDLLSAYFYAPESFNTDGYYWTSTQYSRHYAFVQGFELGNSSWDGKDGERRGRAFRAIHLTT